MKMALLTSTVLGAVFGSAVLVISISVRFLFLPRDPKWNFDKEVFGLLPVGALSGVLCALPLLLLLRRVRKGLVLHSPVKSQRLY
jgi:hypothetical protein